MNVTDEGDKNIMRKILLIICTLTTRANPLETIIHKDVKPILSPNIHDSYSTPSISPALLTHRNEFALEDPLRYQVLRKQDKLIDQPTTVIKNTKIPNLRESQPEKEIQKPIRYIKLSENNNDVLITTGDSKVFKDSDVSFEKLAKEFTLKRSLSRDGREKPAREKRTQKKTATINPTIIPTSIPTVMPITKPTIMPSTMLSPIPTTKPTRISSTIPSRFPTYRPTLPITITPTINTMMIRNSRPNNVNSTLEEKKQNSIQEYSNFVLGIVLVLSFLSIAFFLAMCYKLSR